MIPVAAAMGVANAGLQIYGAQQAKKSQKKLSKLQDKADAYRYQAGLRDIGHEEEANLHKDEFDKRAINESHNERGTLDSSIRTDDQNERQYQLDTRLRGLKEAKQDLEFGYLTSEKGKSIRQKAAKTQEMVGMLSSFLGGGAAGVGSFMGASNLG